MSAENLAGLDIPGSRKFETQTDQGFVATFYTPDHHFTLAAQTNDLKTQILAHSDHEKASVGILHGLPILFDRSRNLRGDISFFQDLVQAQIGGGGVVIMIDHRDNYVPTGDPTDYEGAYYALLNTTRKIRGEDRFKRTSAGIIPLPAFTRLLGRAFVWTKEGDDKSDTSRWSVPDVTDFLNGMFPGRVCLADGTFHRVDANIRNEGIVPPLGGYRRAHGLMWEDPLCQVGISPEGVERFIQAYNSPDELLVVRGNQIVLVNTRTEEEQILTDGQLVGKLTPGGESTWIKGLKHPSAPARDIYDVLD